MPQAAPFWLCHECGAQMRPLMVDGVPHCASCNGEFLEILDEDVNPDPHRQLPHPPTRPGQAATGVAGAPPVPPRPGHTPPQTNESPGILSGLFESLFGTAGGEHDQQQAGPSYEQQPPQRNPGLRTWNFNMGGGAATVTFGSFPPSGARGGAPPFSPFPGGYVGAPGNPDDGLDSFFRGFGAQPPNRNQPMQLQGAELLQALMSIIAEDGGAPGLFPRAPGRLGDYVMTEQGFTDVLERLMQAAGPQGPLPAPDAVIEGLPRFKFDENLLAESQYKDCPVCMDDFEVGQEVLRIECKHIFHPDCVIPWLKTNGSCPVCRFSLVPTPGDGPATAGPATQAERSNAEGGAGESAEGATTGGALATAQGVITNMLNRLFGQGGTEPNDPPPPQPGAVPTPPGQAAQTGAAAAGAANPPGPAVTAAPSAGPATTSGGPVTGQPPPATPTSISPAAARALDDANAAMQRTRAAEAATRRSQSPTSVAERTPRRMSSVTDTELSVSDDPPVPALVPDPSSPTIAPIPNMSTAIPDDYRAMHHRREAEMAAREEQGRRGGEHRANAHEYDPVVDDLD